MKSLVAITLLVLLSACSSTPRSTDAMLATLNVFKCSAVKNASCNFSSSGKQTASRDDRNQPTQQLQPLAVEPIETTPQSCEPRTFGCPR